MCVKDRALSGQTININFTRWALFLVRWERFGGTVEGPRHAVSVYVHHRLHGLCVCVEERTGHTIKDEFYSKVTIYCCGHFFLRGSKKRFDGAFAGTRIAPRMCSSITLYVVYVLTRLVKTPPPSRLSAQLCMFCQTDARLLVRMETNKQCFAVALSLYTLAYILRDHT